ncbi:MAG: pyridoxal-phosphate dependent enzyme [Gemmatimonas sp.]|nr:pyridoxal-phosphate dependent enzyme [Gemmatimonas sp.]
MGTSRSNRRDWRSRPCSLVKKTRIPLLASHADYNVYLVAVTVASPAFPTLPAIRAARHRLGDRVETTSVRRLRDHALDPRLPTGSALWLKEELFQRTGSFKPRGALTVIMSLTPEQLARGVTGVSAGNHAISLAYSARELGSTAKVVMPRTANPYRIAMCTELGAEVVLVENVHEAFETARAIERDEGRTFVHPYEGPLTALGTATVGLEFIEQTRANGVELDAVVVAAGGGGLTGGVACAVKLLAPAAQLFVVEPEGADTMHRSFAAGTPQGIDKVRTIADSLGAPRCEPYSFALNQAYVDDVVLVSDDAIRDAMRLLYRSAKLVTEPAGAASLAAVVGPLRDRLAGQQVGVVVCGGNVDAASFCRYLALDE